MRAVVTLLALFSLLWQQWGDRCHTCEECAVAVAASHASGWPDGAADCELTLNTSGAGPAAEAQCSVDGGPIGAHHEEHDSEACPRQMVRGALPANLPAAFEPSMECAPAFMTVLSASACPSEVGLARLDRSGNDAFVRAPLRAELNVWRL